MDQKERKRRPKLARTQPIRSWSTLFSQAEDGDKRRPGAHAAAPQAPESEQEEQEDKDRSHAQAGQRSGFEDTVAQSVELGYRVVDEYVRRGQEAAQRMRAGTYGASAFVQDARDVAERMIRGISDVVGAWGELLELGTTEDEAASTAAEPSAAAGEVTEAEPAQPGEEQAPLQSGPWCVCVRVEAGRTAEVTVDVDASFNERAISVHALRATDGSDARIDDVGFELDSNGMPTIVVRIAAGQPSGIYRGMVVDASSGRALGSLRVSIHDG